MEITSNHTDYDYQKAQRRVQKLKSFYKHLSIYCIINCFIIYFNIKNLHDGESYFQFKNFLTAFFWGIGLFSHAVKVFAPNIFLGEDWEARKIKELMSKDQTQSQKWS